MIWFAKYWLWTHPLVSSFLCVFCCPCQIDPAGPLPVSRTPCTPALAYAAAASATSLLLSRADAPSCRCSLYLSRTSPCPDSDCPAPSGSCRSKTTACSHTTAASIVVPGRPSPQPTASFGSCCPSVLRAGPLSLSWNRWRFGTFCGRSCLSSDSSSTSQSFSIQSSRGFWSLAVVSIALFAVFLGIWCHCPAESS